MERLRVEMFPSTRLRTILRANCEMCDFKVDAAQVDPARERHQTLNKPAITTA